MITFQKNYNDVRKYIKMNMQKLYKNPIYKDNKF